MQLDGLPEQREDEYWRITLGLIALSEYDSKFESLVTIVQNECHCDRTVAEDLVSDAIVKVILRDRSDGKEDPINNVRAFIVRTAVNLYLNRSIKDAQLIDVIKNKLTMRCEQKDDQGSLDYEYELNEFVATLSQSEWRLMHLLTQDTKCSVIAEILEVPINRVYALKAALKLRAVEFVEINQRRCGKSAS